MRTIKGKYKKIDEKNLYTWNNNIINEFKSDKFLFNDCFKLL